MQLPSAVGPNPSLPAPMRSDIFIPQFPNALLPEFLMAEGLGFADDTKPLQNIINQAAAALKSVLLIGKYRTTSPIILPANTHIIGINEYTSEIIADHNGDALQSIFPINSSSLAQLVIEHVGIRTTKTATNAGAGLNQVGGSFVRILQSRFAFFKWPIVFDQTEVATIADCTISMGGISQFGIWCTNGPDHTVGANVNFTNAINIQRNYFAGQVGLGTLIAIDGGANVVVTSNTLSGGANAVRIAALAGGEVSDNYFEFATVRPLIFTNTTALLGTAVGPSNSVPVHGNTVQGAGASHAMEFLAGHNIKVYNNALFLGVSGVRYVQLSGEDISGITFERNTKTIRGVSREGLPFITANNQAQVDRCDTSGQKPQAYVPLAIAAGAGQVVTPSTMGVTGTGEAIIVGSKLFVVNDDGTNGENVTVTATAATTFTATFVSAKAINSAVYGF